MSRHDWEHGRIRLPAAAFSSFRREFNEFFNQRQAKLLAKATEIFENASFQATVKDLTKGCKGKIYSPALEEAIRTHLRVRITLCGYYTYDAPSRPMDGADEIYHVLLPYNATKITRPTKNHFAPVNPTSNELHGGAWTIMFDPKSHSVIWDVPENNHACLRAREHTVSKKFFEMLYKVKWVRGSGGTIVGNDEYNRDSVGASSGANYVTARLGPLGDSPVGVRHY